MSFDRDMRDTYITHCADCTRCMLVQGETCAGCVDCAFTLHTLRGCAFIRCIHNPRRTNGLPDPRGECIYARTGDSKAFERIGGVKGKDEGATYVVKVKA